MLLGDMPLVDAAMLSSLVDAFRRGRAPLAVSTFGDVVAPPILYGRPLFAELRALADDACGKSVIRKHRAEALALPWPEERLTDLDAPEENSGREETRAGFRCTPGLHRTSAIPARDAAQVFGGRGNWC